MYLKTVNFVSGISDKYYKKINTKNVNMDQNAVATNGIETFFPSDDEEKDLRVYGATRETATSAPKVRPALKDVSPWCCLVSC